MKQSKKCVITLVVNDVSCDKPICRQILSGIANSLKTIDVKVANYLSLMIGNSQYICMVINEIVHDF